MAAHRHSRLAPPIGPHPPGDAGSRRRFDWPLAVVLGLLAAVLYLPSLSLPFIGDDYVFLDETRNLPFPRLWSFHNTQFGWYRPWSREMHFWSMQSIAGLNPVAFRVAGLGLWAASLGLYAALVRRLSTTPVSILAVIGVATLAMWGTPILWISGSQDLWMVFFALATLLLYSSGRAHWGLLTFLGALISKETAAVLVVVVTGYTAILSRQKIPQVIWRTLPYWALVLVWFALHPTLHERLLGQWVMPPGGEQHVDAITVIRRTLLSTVNLDTAPHPTSTGPAESIRLVLAVLIAAFGMRLLLKRYPPPTASNPIPRDRLLVFASLWALAGWAPLVLPSIGWHAYYGCLGTLGAWLAISVSLESRRRTALTTIAVLSILQWCHANTPSGDWGSEWYQRRAGRFLNAIQRNLQHQHPRLPSHSRVFFAHLPNNIGLVAGQSPALRVWYADSTLQADFYSNYRPRLPSDAEGVDYFFRFDTLAGMVEVHAGPEELTRERLVDPQWESDHENIAMVFMRSHDYERAALEFEKISRLPRRPDALLYAAAAHLLAGDSTRAAPLLAVAQSRMRLDDAKLRQAIRTLIANAPS